MIENKQVILKTSHLATLKVWYCFDSSANHAYNHEYTVDNELINEQHTFSSVEYYGDNNKAKAEETFDQTVSKNKEIIERAKAYLNTPAAPADPLPLPDTHHETQSDT